MSDAVEDPFPLLQEGKSPTKMNFYKRKEYQGRLMCDYFVECKQSHHCHPFLEKLEQCTTRVEGDENTDETCVEEFFDLMVLYIFNRRIF